MYTRLDIDVDDLGVGSDACDHKKRAASSRGRPRCYVCSRRAREAE